MTEDKKDNKATIDASIGKQITPAEAAACVRSGDRVYVASAECAIRKLCPQPDKVWACEGGQPVIVYADHEKAHHEE